jgi:nitroreductase
MELQKTINERRAYRSLSKTEITNETVKILSKTAQLAPSCFNNQPWRFVFVKDPDKLKELFSALSKGNEWAYKSSLIIAVFSQKSLDCVVGKRVYYLLGTGMSIGFLQLKATELGLVAHPIAGFDEDKAKQILKIPEEMRLITLIIVGKHNPEVDPNLKEHQQKDEKRRPARKPLSEFVYIDEFSNSIEG